MNDIELAQWLIDRKQEVNTEIGLLLKEQDQKRFPIFRKLLRVNNSLVETFQELMIVRERMGLTPLALPNK